MSLLDQHLDFKLLWEKFRSCTWPMAQVFTFVLHNKFSFRSYVFLLLFCILAVYCFILGQRNSKWILLGKALFSRNLISESKKRERGEKNKRNEKYNYNAILQFHLCLNFIYSVTSGPLTFFGGKKHFVFKLLIV